MSSPRLVPLFNPSRKWKDKSPKDLQCFRPRRSPLDFEKAQQASSDEAFEKYFMQLFSKIHALVSEVFGSIDIRRGTSPWVREYSDEFYSYVTAVAQQDARAGKWDRLLRMSRERTYLIQAAIMKILDGEVLSRLCFGSRPDHKWNLDAADASLLKLEGFRRSGLRTHTNSVYLSDSGCPPPLFWVQVDEIAAKTAQMLLPLYNTIGQAKDGNIMPLEEFTQRLHEVVADAGLINIAIRLSPSIITIDWAKPGDTFEFGQVHLEPDIYQESKAKALRGDLSAMSTPYWGQLPGPKIARDRRMSADDSAYDQRHSLDARPAQATNRASVQTTSNTESTFSPILSPTASSFAAQGLAPRPPSYAGGPDRTAHHQNPEQVDPYDQDPLPATSAAPDPSRAPRVSYRHPYGNGGLPYTHPEPAPTQSIERGEPTAPMEHDDHYSRRGAEPSSLRASASGTAERRKKLANERSPLQRLELTLDSMTKEEKRARMVAAEQRARERARLKAAGETAPSQHVASHHSRPVVTHDDRPGAETRPRVAQAAAEVARPEDLPVYREPITRREPPIQHPREPEGGEYFASGALREPEQGPIQPAAEPQTDIPKRNLSFRERTTRQDVPVIQQETRNVAAAQPVSVSSGFSLTRSGSNKLKKDPPVDSKYSRRVEPESRVPSMTARNDQFSDSYQPAAQPDQRFGRDKPLPQEPTTFGVGRPNVDHSRHQFIKNDPHFGNIQRRATEPIHSAGHRHTGVHAPPQQGSHNFERNVAGASAVAAATQLHDNPNMQARRHRRDSDSSSDSSHHHHVSNRIFRKREQMAPGDGLYLPPQWLEEWKQATVGTLSGSLLDLDEQQLPGLDKNKAWWEDGSQRRSSSNTARSRNAEAFDGEYDNTNAPTRFRPPLYLKCGPLLRYCGIRREKISARPTSKSSDREMWRGSVMIVTQDSDSSYEIAPTLRLFLQDIELLPPPPHQVDGELSPEYVDPLAGYPKLGRRGETLYVRPVEDIEEAKDLSRDETDNGLFEMTRSPLDVASVHGSSEPSNTFSSRQKRIKIDGEKVQKYKDQRIAYRVNRGPAMSFWVPARGEAMNMMFYSCNGFSSSVKTDEFSGPDPLWRDVLNSHQSRPFHAMIGGGDQIYNDAVSHECKLFDKWLDIKNPLHKHNAPFTAEMQAQMEHFYFERYCMWFSQGLFGLANSQIPMVNMYDDHDVFDGYGSYPHHDMNSPVMTGLGAVGFKYYMLFQHQSLVTEMESNEPSWIIGNEPGPYINELSRSLFLSMGGKVALLAVDCRTERTEEDVMHDNTWDKIMERMYAAVSRGQIEHLLVVLGVPIAYPRLVWLENILTSRLMDPIKAIGKTGMLGNVLNNIDGGVEVLDDLNDHWTAKNHKHERKFVIEELQDFAIDKSVRVTILSGDVHLAAIGQFYSHPKLGIVKHKDARYMPNIISSAIVNAPPPDLLADVLNRRNKVHHFDKNTEEDMIPIFQAGVDGKPRNNKRLLPHRNWCSINVWQPGTTPPPTPPMSDDERSPSPPPKRSNSLLRRFSLSKGPSYRPDVSRDSVRGPRPPISGGGVGGLFRSLSRRNSTSDAERPAKLTRTMSLGGGDAPKRGFFSFGRSSQKRPDDAGVNGQWGDETDDDYYYEPQPGGHGGPSGLRGGAAYDEYSEGDEAYFTAQPPRRAQTMGGQPAYEPEGPPTRPFHRTPTGLSVKQMRKEEDHQVNLEGGLDICLNVEVNPKDPTGITVPYRMLVPKLLYEYVPEKEEALEEEQPSGFKRLLSFRKKPKVEDASPMHEGPGTYMDDRTGIQEQQLQAVQLWIVRWLSQVLNTLFRHVGGQFLLPAIAPPSPPSQQVPIAEPVYPHTVPAFNATSCRAQTPDTVNTFPNPEEVLLGSKKTVAHIKRWLRGPGRRIGAVFALRFWDRIKMNLAPRRLFSFPHLLVACWIIILLWGERWLFNSKVASCDWENWEAWPKGTVPHHLVLLADPQLIDPHSYPGRPWPLNPLTVAITDNYLRRGYRAMQTYLHPDSLFFLGDLFDGGREWSTRHGKFVDPKWGRQRSRDEAKWVNTWHRKYGEDYWLREYKRFGNIFFDDFNMAGNAPGAWQRGRKLAASLPGNHDLGFGAQVQVSVRDRFSAYFGDVNRVDVVGNHTIVSVDSVSLSADSSNARDAHDLKPIYGPVNEFLDQVRSTKRKAVQQELSVWHGEKTNLRYNHVVEDLQKADLSKLPKADPGTGSTEFPTILLTHVPLYRPPGTPCGPLREHWPPAKRPQGQTEPVVPDHRNAITVAAGYQYQNVLSEEDSVKLVKSVGNVVHVFSGDDHDYCELVHSDSKENVREITVKSMSMAMGVPTPGFLMVSLYNPVDEHGVPIRGSSEHTLQTHLCLLPNQLHTYMMYVCFGVLSLVLLAVRAFLVPALNLHPFALELDQGNASFLLPVTRGKQKVEPPDEYRTHPGNGAPHPAQTSSIARNGWQAKRSKGRGWGSAGGPRIRLDDDFYDGGKAWKADQGARGGRALLKTAGREMVATTWRVVWLAVLFFGYLTKTG
ncbi:Metallophosphoesterase domain protein [Paramyrothecium foliicola]|nr:Metallophosphoesterase domain protein [Paramyrothecium foliicola]